MNTTLSKTILITGVSKGLGKALAEKFIQMGHRVIGCSRSEAITESLQKRYGNDHHFSAVDVSDYNAVYRWFKFLQTHIPNAPDFLINNAAIINKPHPIWDVDPNDFGKVMDINIKGTFHVLRAFVPWMIQRNMGVIINFSSGWGRSVSPEVGPYCASKFAIEGMTLALAQELPSGMVAVPLNPGIIDTDMLRECFGRTASSYPGPSEWANKAAPFILSLSTKDTGKSLSVT